jgi:hypothetical protein
MITVILTCLIKQFFFMRIVPSFSYIVTMITNVVGDLRVFMTFYCVLIVSFSMVFNIISENDSPEYSKVGSVFGNIMTTMRLSLGDFKFDILDGLSPKQHIMFWVIWTLMVLFSALIFLNFIIAEVSNSYQSCKQKIDSLIYKERAAMIQEVEDMMEKDPEHINTERFPKYIVIRQQED